MAEPEQSLLEEVLTLAIRSGNEYEYGWRRDDIIPAIDAAQRCKVFGSGFGYLDYFGEMVQCQVSKCSLPVPSTDGCRRRMGIETMQVEVGYTTGAVDE